MLKDQVIKLRDKAEKCPCSRCKGKFRAYSYVLDLIDKEPDYKNLLEECLLLAKVFKAMVKPISPAAVKANEIIKRLEEVLK